MLFLFLALTLAEPQDATITKWNSSLSDWSASKKAAAANRATAQKKLARIEALHSRVGLNLTEKDADAFDTALEGMNAALANEFLSEGRAKLAVVQGSNLVRALATTNNPDAVLAALSRQADLLKAATSGIDSSSTAMQTQLLAMRAILDKYK